MILLILWLLGLAIQGINVGFALQQRRHPYGSPRWRAAWGWAGVAHCLILVRRGWLLGTWLLTNDIPDAPKDVIEQLLSLGLSSALLLFHWHIAHIFLSKQSHLLHPRPPIEQLPSQP